MNYDAEYSAYVGNLDGSVPVADLEELIFELFLQAGPVEKVYFPLDSATGQHRKHGFVEFEHQESVPYAILLLNGVCLFGRPLRVGPVGKTDVFPAVTGDAETADAATMETADSACTPLSPQDEAAATILAAQMLGLPLPVLNEAMALPMNGPTPPLSSASNVQPPIQPGGPVPLFSCAPLSANDDVQPPLSQPSGMQTGTSSLFGCTPISSAENETQLHLAPSQLPSSGPTPLFSQRPLSSSNGEMHPTLGCRLSPLPESPPHHRTIPPSTTSNELAHFGHRLSPAPKSPGHVSLPPPTGNEFGPSPHNPQHLGLRSDDLHPTLGSRLSPPTSSALRPSASDTVHPTLGRRMSPPSRNQRLPSWEHDVISNGNGSHSRAWENNHSGENFWEDKPPKHNADTVPPWERLPGVANGNHTHHSHSRWSPGRISEERMFRKDHEDTSNSYRGISRTEEFETSHSDDATFSESHPFDHTHRRMHENRLHSDDMPSWVTEQTKNLIRNHHLTKLTETLAQYQQQYAKN